MQRVTLANNNNNNNNGFKVRFGVERRVIGDPKHALYT